MIRNVSQKRRVSSLSTPNNSKCAPVTKQIIRMCLLFRLCIYVDDANITGSGSGDELQNKTSHLQSSVVCYVNSWINLLDILRPEQTDHHFAGGI